MHRDFVFGADIEIPFSGYPTDTDSREEWELYWRCRSKVKQRQARVRPSDPLWLSTFAARGYHTMLLVGNGMSQEPQFFAFAGYMAVAMDLSAEVTDTASKARWQTRTLLDSFGISSERERGFLREIHQLGGSANYAQGDLFDGTACPGPFDVVLSRRTLQLFDGPRLDDAIAQLKQRLSPTGTLLIEVYQDLYAHCAIKQRLQEHGFVLRAEDPSAPWNAELLLSKR